MPVVCAGDRETGSKRVQLERGTGTKGRAKGETEEKSRISNLKVVTLSSFKFKRRTLDLWRRERKTKRIRIIKFTHARSNVSRQRMATFQNFFTELLKP